MSFFKRVKRNVKQAVTMPTPGIKKPDGNYFENAKDWAYERYQIQEVMANRWQLAFWLSMIFSVLLLVVYVMLFPLKTWDPIVVNRNTQTGEVWVQPATTHYLPSTEAEVKSDLVQYVIARETISPMDNNLRERKVLFSSSPMVAKAYQMAMGHPNVSLRIVKIIDAYPLNNGSNAVERHKQDSRDKVPTMGQVDFTTSEVQGSGVVQKNWVATIKFTYLGTPSEQDAAFANWNGFTVTDYRVDQRSI